MKRAKKKAVRSRAIQRGPRPATAADILGVTGSGSAASKESVPRKWARHYRVLVRLRSELMRKMGHLSQEAMEDVPSFSEHMADAASDSFDRDFTLGLLSSEQEALTEIDQALKRIQEGSYGICEATGKPISKSRLEAIPWARFSLEAQRQLEREGATGRPRLGTLGQVIGNLSSEAETAEAEEE